VSKEKKNEPAVTESKKNIFHYDELKQGDAKQSNYSWISPDYNPGCLKRIKSQYNKQKKYQIQKELYYTRDNKKVIMSVGEIISFILPHQLQLQIL
jgi:hypothetical protein